jgi:hypothetical protein
MKKEKRKSDEIDTPLFPHSSEITFSATTFFLFNYSHRLLFG